MGNTNINTVDSTTINNKTKEMKIEGSKNVSNEKEEDEKLSKDLLQNMPSTQDIEEDNDDANQLAPGK